MVRAAVAASVETLELPSRRTRLQDTMWMSPVTVRDPTFVHIALQEGASEDIEYRIYSPHSVDTHEANGVHLHAKGRVIRADAQPAEPVDIEGLRRACTHAIDAQRCYKTFGDLGLVYGPAHQTLQALHFGAMENGGRFILAELQMPDCVAADASRFELHPSLLDGAFQACIGFALSNQGAQNRSQSAPAIPFAVHQVDVIGPTPPRALAFCRASSSADSSSLESPTSIDIDVCDDAGRTCVQIRGLTSRVLAPSSTDEAAVESATGIAGNARAETVMFTPQWVEFAPVWTSSADGAGVRVLVVGATEAQWQSLLGRYPGAARLDVDTFRHVDDIETQLAALGSIEHVFWILPPREGRADLANFPAAQQQSVCACFGAIKALLRLGYGGRALNWTVITHCAQHVRPTDQIDPTHAAMHGLIGVVAKEYPHWHIRLIDLASGDWPLDDILRLRAHPQGDALLYRDGAWLSRRFLPWEIQSLQRSAFRRGGVYIIIGGAGGVGEVLTEYLVRTYQAHVVWVGRRAKDVEIDSKLERLGAIGPKPAYVSADARDAAALTRVYEAVRKEHAQVHGVVHSTAELLDQSVAAMTPETFHAGVSAKIDVAIQLAHIFGVESLDFMLFFSSTQSFAKPAGQANYAAGCNFVDAFALSLSQAFSCAVRVINWGYWALGVAAGETHRQRMTKMGVSPIAPAQAMAALESLLAGGPEQCGFVSVTGSRSLPGLSLDEQESQQHRPSLQASLSRAAATESQTIDIITEVVAEALKMDSRLIEPDRAFAEYGVDSIIGLQIVPRLNAALEIDMSETTLFDHGSVNKLARHIAREHQPSHPQAHSGSAAGTVRASPIRAASAKRRVRPSEVAAIRRPQSTGPSSAMPESAREPIAIVGISGRFGPADSLAELWDRVAGGEDLTEEVSRWDLSAYLGPAQDYCRRGSFLRDVDRFDPLFFGISPAEAKYMDPQQRFFLEESWKALEDAGYAGAATEQQRCGVYAGYNGGDYQQLMLGQAPAQALWGTAGSVVSARIAYFLNLHGPAITVDTACSSGLVATYLACQALWADEITLALAGGVFIQCTPGFHVTAAKAGLLSASSRCRAFDEHADGYVPGEGVSVLVLKRLSRAVADGDHIHGVIRAIGVNQVGASNGFAAPSAASQLQLEREVYERFGVDPDQIQFVEAHGTGTKIGDAIEVAALTRAFREHTQRSAFCALGSIKANLGHCTAASGLASIAKVLLSMKHRALPPQLNFERTDPQLALADSPFYVNTDLKPWAVEPGALRQASVSCFGISGTNAHAVIEEWPDTASAQAARSAHLIGLSARTADQLRQQVAQLAAHVAAQDRLECGNVSYTLLLGRKHMAYRFACVVGSARELLDVLHAWLDADSATLEPRKDRQRPTLQRYAEECVRRCCDCDDEAEYKENLETIAELYLQGYAPAFEGLFAGRVYRRIPLPTYPFARDRHWVGVEPDVHSAAPVNASPASGAGVQPRTELEKVLAHVWCEILEVSTIAVDTQFLEVGGNSLLATMIVSRLEELFGVEIPVTSLLSGESTVERLSIEVVSALARMEDPDQLDRELEDLGA